MHMYAHIHLYSYLIEQTENYAKFLKMNLEYKIDPNYLIRHEDSYFKFKDLINYYLLAHKKVK